jgi:hypothetical protein
MKHISTLCRQNVKLLLSYVTVCTVGDTCTNHCVLNVKFHNADVLFMFHFSETSLFIRF